ncbi:hypothetical protein [Labedaea rhizosphaerae]|uniref:Uncharacterized protein n=1 Tax=Labedaea rhizosphaerae TaxID=598644 RepID=A0A4R6SB61_LABRH|nr:hypothetical protein [Labedaea rhizosphaerae]TDP97279.1 hypothetical protein EV186_103242 [Labedaea rhizosphaerae]
MIDFDERDVPADVRDRITDTVHRGMAEPTRRGLRMPLAVAAAVAVLAVAGVVTALTVHNRAEQLPAGPASSTPTAKTEAADELDRCWKAVVAEGKQGAFPARSTWTTVQRQPSTSANVTALRAGGKTFFCMTTKATVTVTDPNAKVAVVPGTRTRVALVDDNGWILAVGIDPNATGVMVSTGQGYEVGAPAVDGMLVIQVEPRRDLEANARFVGDNRVEYDVPKKIPPVPAPAVELVDRPLPAPDRTSADGKRLGNCLANTGWTKAYADQWQPGVSVEDGQWYAELATSKDQFGLCVHTEHAGRQGQFDFSPLAPVPATTKPRYLLLDRSTYAVGHGFHQFAVGTAPTGAQAVTVTTNDGTAHPAVVHDGLWAVVLPATDPDQAPAQVPSTVKSVMVKDAAGVVIYDGPPVVVRG